MTRFLSKIFLMTIDTGSTVTNDHDRHEGLLREISSYKTETAHGSIPDVDGTEIKIAAEVCVEVGPGVV
jgi:hypothetical protein